MSCRRGLCLWHARHQYIPEPPSLAINESTLGMADGSNAKLGLGADAAEGSTAGCEEEEEEEGPLPAALPESETSSPKSSWRRKSSEKGNISTLGLSLAHSVCVLARSVGTGVRADDDGGGGDGDESSGRRHSCTEHLLSSFRLHDTLTVHLF